MTSPRLYASLIVVTAFGIFIFFGSGNVIPAVLGCGIAFLAWKLFAYVTNSYESGVVANVEATRLKTALASQQKFKGFADHMGVKFLNKAERDAELSLRSAQLKSHVEQGRNLVAKNTSKQSIQERLEFAQDEEAYLQSQVQKSTEAELERTAQSEKRKIEEQRKRMESGLAQSRQQKYQTEFEVAETVELARQAASLKLKSYQF